MWADSHCHLPYEGLEDVDSHLAAARLAGVGRMVSVGTDADQSASAIKIASQHPDVWATVGLHPHDASRGLDGIEALLGQPRVVAVGECGLDYHYDHSPRDVQRDVFAAQIQMALAHDLALVIHTREAWADTWDVLESEGVPDRTVFHCFTGGPDEARRCLDLGAALSFSGIVTFKKANDVQAAARLCPLDRLLVETDSPFLAPVPHRGETNTPSFVPLVGAAVAAVKGVAESVVEAATWDNAGAIFGL